MLSNADKEILINEDFQLLVRRRRWLSWSLLIVLQGLYLIFGLMSVYAPASLSRPLVAGGVIPVGIAFGYAILALTFVFTAVYVWVANHYFEPLERKVIREVRP